MRLASFLLAAGVASAASSGLLELDLLFPHDNATYEPSEFFPIIIAAQNPHLARNLSISIPYDIRNMTTDPSEIDDNEWVSSGTIKPDDFSYIPPDGGPSVTGTWRNLTTEGRYRLFFHAYWAWCDDAFESGRGDNDSAVLITFTVRRGGQKADLFAAAGDTGRAGCASQAIALVNVTGETDRTGAGETCAVMPASNLTATPDPCRVTVGEDAVQSMLVYRNETMCKWVDPPIECPEEDAGRIVTAYAPMVAVIALAAVGGLIV